ncbi:MAG: hypothetical protein EPO10_27945 [Reyranella sp.]|uniref:hypothetical protein n=1 Tax=Reyranella sp. TaxID=1929291 RepID=UPI0012299B8A|nr:hypothetical protein [Reyranella sp.]TAJ97002.1 MAG: hypothetical protein EPO41_04750 [Reyranella sp.]TBR22708.1 MAG: hypothetical protein EPO10_27945 [Reyranella sp.]
MATDVDIGNMSLSRLGTRATIADLTENSTEARQLSLWYETVRDDLLGMLDWNFNRVSQPLASSGTPPDRWAYSYAYPSDCLKIWRLDFGGSCWIRWNGLAVPFEVASDGTNQFLLCNDSIANAIYGQRVTDPARFSPPFVLAFVDCLAAAVALPITQKADLAERLARRAQERIEKAMADSANEQSSTERFQVAESLAVRGYEEGSAVWLQSIYR